MGVGLIHSTVPPVTYQVEIGKGVEKADNTIYSL